MQCRRILARIFSTFAQRLHTSVGFRPPKLGELFHCVTHFMEELKSIVGPRHVLTTPRAHCANGPVFGAEQAQPWLWFDQGVSWSSGESSKPVAANKIIIM